MENLFQSIKNLQRSLENSGVSSIVIGGVAVAVWGDPRVTRDVDLKVRLGREDADRLLGLLSPDYSSLLPDPVGALQHQGMVFVQDTTGTRIDLLLADTPYDLAAIQRGREVEVAQGLVIRICSPEDLIIYKLVATRPRDYEDAQSIIRRQDKNLDDAYLIGWLRQFETALDDSTLVAEYKQMRNRYK